MANKIRVYKGRTNIIKVALGINVSADTITSEIRAEPDVSSPLIATWTVAKVGGGTTGDLTLTLDDGITSEITARSGYMDIKRVSSGEPLPVFDDPLEVEFIGSVTA